MADAVFKDPYSRAVGVSTVSDLKKQLLARHRAQKKGIIERLDRGESGFNTDQLLNLIVEDMLEASEDLQGTSLFLEKEGDLSSSSAVIIKRADLLRLIADIVSRKKELSQRSGEVDLNAPVFRIFQKLCFDKMAESLEELKVEAELVNLILTRWQGKMKDWDRELRKALREIDA